MKSTEVILSTDMPSYLYWHLTISLPCMVHYSFYGKTSTEKVSSIKQTVVYSKNKFIRKCMRILLCSCHKEFENLQCSLSVAFFCWMYFFFICSAWSGRVFYFLMHKYFIFSICAFPVISLDMLNLMLWMT